MGGRIYLWHKNMFNSYHNPMNNGENVWELGFKVGENKGNLWELGLWVQKNRVNARNWGLGWGNIG